MGLCICSRLTERAEGEMGTTLGGVWRIAFALCSAQWMFLSLTAGHPDGRILLVYTDAILFYLAGALHPGLQGDPLPGPPGFSHSTRLAERVWIHILPQQLLSQL